MLLKPTCLGLFEGLNKSLILGIGRSSGMRHWVLSPWAMGKPVL